MNVPACFQKSLGADIALVGMKTSNLTITAKKSSGYPLAGLKHLYSAVNRKPYTWPPISNQENLSSSTNI